MDIFDHAIVRFWKALQDNEVQYIMVGDYAMALHGYNRITPLISFWLEDTLENRMTLNKVFVDCNIGSFPTLEKMEFLSGKTIFYLDNSLMLDILTTMKGLEGYTFDECLQMASIADIDGIKIPFLHINQLIQNKKATDRPKDRIDVLALEQILKLREEN